MFNLPSIVPDPISSRWSASYVVQLQEQGDPNPQTGIIIANNTSQTWSVQVEGNLASIPVGVASQFNFQYSTKQLTLSPTLPIGTEVPVTDIILLTTLSQRDGAQPGYPATIGPPSS